LTSTCPAVGDGLGTCSIRNTPGCPYRSYTTALIPVPLILRWSGQPSTDASTASGLTLSVTRRDKRWPTRKAVRLRAVRTTIALRDARIAAAADGRPGRLDTTRFTDAVAAVYGVVTEPD
jgi:hypothetical protein